jgi:hypothetical protein
MIKSTIEIKNLTIEPCVEGEDKRVKTKSAPAKVGAKKRRGIFSPLLVETGSSDVNRFF